MEDWGEYITMARFVVITKIIRRPILKSYWYCKRILKILLMINCKS